MKWTAGVKFGPYGSVLILAVILGMSTLGLCKTKPCELNHTCQRIILIDGDFTGRIQMPNVTTTCPNNSLSPSFNDKICFFSFDTSDSLLDLFGTLDNVSTLMETVPTSTPKEVQNAASSLNILDPNDWRALLQKYSDQQKQELKRLLEAHMSHKWKKFLRSYPNVFPEDWYNTNNTNDSSDEQDEIYYSSDIYNCTYQCTGVWLLHKNHTYQINITRDKSIRPTSEICFVKGTCNNTWDDWIKLNFTQCKGHSDQVCAKKGCNITCLDPNRICESGIYDQVCQSSITNDDIIKIMDQPVCTKCGSPLTKPDVQINLKNMSVPDLKEDITDKSEVIMNIASKVLELMGSKSTASVTLGDVQGVFVKPKNLTELEAVAFAYSEGTNLGLIQDETQMANFPWSLSIPKEAFEKAANQNKTALFTAVFRFPSFTKDEKNSTVLNNEVYSIDIGAEIANLTDTINLTFRNVKKNGTIPQCHSWNGPGSKPNWTTDGCNTTETGDSVTCGCVHLTFFALLMVPNPTDSINSVDLSNLTYITSIGCGLSIFFLGVALFMHFLLRRARQSDSVHILINLFVALVLLNLTFLTNEYVANTGNLIGCKLMAGFMHYCLLTSFTWFGLEALHLCLQLGRNSTPIKHYLTKICIAGWAPPAVVVTVVFCLQKYNQLVIHADDGKDVKMCWITDSAVHYVVNIGYYSIIFAFTFTTFVVMLRWIFLLKGTAANRHEPLAGSGKRKGTGTSDALTVMGLCCTLGLTWGFAFFAYGALRLPSYYIFTILNSFQGFFLFIYYYKTSKFLGDQMNSEKTTSTATEATSVENPYEKPKTF